MSPTTHNDIIKDVLSKSWIKILYVIVLLFWIKLYHPTIALIFVVLNSVSVLSWLFNEKSVKSLFVSLFSMNAFLITYIFLAKYLGVLGAAASFIILVLLIAAYLLWRQWDTYVESMRTVERMIWGVALDEEKSKRRSKRRTKKN